MTNSGAPRVEYQYASIFDMTLCMINKTELVPGLADEITQSLSQWQEHWDDKGVKLLDAAKGLVGCGFRHGSYIASVYGFPRFPSMSHPLIIQVNNWVPSGTIEGRPPLPQSIHVSITFHEMLHIYLTEIFAGRSSRFQTEYAKEQGKTRAHLILDALLQASYEKAGFAADLPLIRRFDSSYDRELREYARAWEIVEERGVEPFLSELREFAAKPKS